MSQSGVERATDSRPPLELVERLETSEQVEVEDLYRAAPAAAAEACGLATARIGGALACAAARVDVLALNRVVGLGVRTAPGDGAIDDIVSFYRARGVPRFFIQLAPTEAGDALAARLLARGLVHHNNWVRLHRGPLAGEPPRALAPPMRIEAIGPERAIAFAECVGAAFGWPPALIPWTAAAVGRRYWLHYLALDGERPVGTGALHVQGTVAWLGMASTAPDHRGRGVQNALIARRLFDATSLGCTDLHLETAECQPGKRAPSYHNALRQGFRDVYRRRNYLWKAAE
jgi:hypothetical protein